MKRLPRITTGGAGAEALIGNIQNSRIWLLRYDATAKIIHCPRSMHTRPNTET